jgi:hypothetical protein
MILARYAQSPFHKQCIMLQVAWPFIASMGSRSQDERQDARFASFKNKGEYSGPNREAITIPK